MFIKSLKKIIKIYFLPYRPLRKGREVWEKQFSQNSWNYLGDLYQTARYSIIVGYYDFLFEQNGSILDLGCGQGILLKRLKNFNINAYVGVDLSQEAINLALKIPKNNSLFVCESIENYQPTQKFDLIIFNESLYYLENPTQILINYSDYLTEKGVILISMWDNKERNNKLWGLIDKHFNTITSVYLKKNNLNLAWTIKLLKKKTQ